MRDVPKGKWGIGKRFAHAAFAALALCASPAAWAQDAVSFEPGTSMARIQEAGKLVVGTRFDIPAVALRNPITGEMEGFDVRVAKAVAKRLGLTEDQIEYREVISANRETAISQNLVDINVSGYVVTDKRRELVGQAGPYINVHSRLFVHEDNLDKYNTVEDIRGARICSTPTGTPVAIIERLGGVLVTSDDISVCKQHVINKIVDGSISNDLNTVGFLDHYPGLKVARTPTLSDEAWGIGFKKDDAAFCEFLTGAISDIVASGEYRENFEATFGALGLPYQEPPTPDDHC